jgi:predicted flap endonuclease-1-like 5' DNA nuclease
VLPFQRPEPPAPGDLDRLPGAGPGLVWALERAGLCRLADLAPLAPAELATRLGPLGRLVPAQAWIKVARDACPA